MSKNIYNPLNLDNPVPVDFADMSRCIPEKGKRWGGFDDKKHSPETRKEMSESSFNRKGLMTEETRKKISEYRLGKKHSPETIQKMSETSTGKKHSPETIAKLRVAQTGRKLSEETKKKMSEAQNKRYGKKI